MSEDVGHELQVAIVARLKADAAVSALIGDRIYDRVPQGVTLPYVSFGPETTLPEEADGLDLGELTLQLDVWSEDPGFREARRIAKAVCRSLDDADITLADNALTFLRFDRRQVMRDPDGLTSHVALTFTAGVEEF